MLVKTFRCLISAIILCATVSHVDSASATEDPERAVEYLLEFVAESKNVFIRNDTAHDGREAAKHMRKKYEHFKKEIRTPEDFIRLAASKSLATGKPYVVKTGDGKKIRCDEWMGNILKKYRESRKKRTFDESAPDERIQLF